MLTDENKCLRSRAWSPQCVFFFRCFTPETLAKRFHLWQSLPCLNEEGMPCFCAPWGLPETPLCCPASLAPWEQPDWAEHRIRSRRCWLPARCRTNLWGMFPLAGSLPLAPAPNDISPNCCYLWFFLLFIWITAKTARLSQIFGQLVQWEAWQ